MSKVPKKAHQHRTGMNKDVERYFIDGCGRCPLGGTPDCKVHTWAHELAQLRRILRATELTETSKWGQPCYTVEGKNVVILSTLKDFAVLGFFKGVLLKDPEGLLVSVGKNSQSDMRLNFTDVQQVLDQEAAIKALVAEAIEVEKAGLKVEFKKEPEPMPEELLQKFDEDPELKAAFEALTPGRQRGYILHISSAKQSKTRLARIEKHRERILSGKGMHDR